MTGTSQEDQYTFLVTSRSIPLRMRNVSHKSCRENQNIQNVKETGCEDVEGMGMAQG